MTSGRTAASTASSTAYSSSPRSSAARTAPSTSAAASSEAARSARSRRPAARRSPAGWSHSWLRPTSASPRPTAATISVAEGSRETMRTRQGYATIAAMTLYDRVADLELVIDDHALRAARAADAALHARLDRRGPGRRRGGGPGRGRHLRPHGPRRAAHAPTCAARTPSARSPDASAPWTRSPVSTRCPRCDAWPTTAAGPSRARRSTSRCARRAARSARARPRLPPVRFCVSAGAPERVARDRPDAEFKLDATPDVDARAHGGAARHGPRRVVDLKALLRGHVVDNPPDRPALPDVVECFPDAVIEDAKPTDETRDVLSPPPTG